MVGGTLAAGSANALNCYVDRDIDALMRRTTHRPLARHDVSPTGALVFGLVLGLLAVGLMGGVTNWLAAGLTAAAIAFYVVVYTMLLKRRTAQNIVWGGAAGCMPVLIGWSAVTGSLAWPPVVLFAVVFFWTPPHFWALAIRYREDYARAGVPMLPVVASPQRVAREIVVYSWLTARCRWRCGRWPPAGSTACSRSLAGAALIVAAHRLLAPHQGRSRTPRRPCSCSTCPTATSRSCSWPSRSTPSSADLIRRGRPSSRTARCARVHRQSRSLTLARKLGALARRRALRASAHRVARCVRRGRVPPP